MIENLPYKVHGFLTRSYIDLYTRYVNYKNSAPIDPYRLYEISPDRITHEVQSQFWYQPNSTIKDGDWDMRVSEFKKHPFYISLKKHFGNGVPWEETKLYERKLQELSRGDINEDRYGNSKESILKRLESLDDLYRHIKENGYKTQRELRNYNNLAVNTQREHLPPELFEISVNIGRNGQWLFDDGRNRLTIAKLLGIDIIPVRVLVRHQKWQNTRNEIYESNIDTQNIEELLDHKDIEVLTQY